MDLLKDFAGYIVQKQLTRISENSGLYVALWIVKITLTLALFNLEALTFLVSHSPNDLPSGASHGLIVQAGIDEKNESNRLQPIQSEIHNIYPAAMPEPIPDKPYVHHWYIDMLYGHFAAKVVVTIFIWAITTFFGY